MLTFQWPMSLSKSILLPVYKGTFHGAGVVVPKSITSQKLPFQAASSYREHFLYCWLLLLFFTYEKAKYLVM